MTDSAETNKNPKRGVLLRAQNGDVIGFDETGLRLNLADSVIANIQQRLNLSLDTKSVDASVLGDINAWDVREANGWYLFHAHLPGAQGIGQFRRSVDAEGENPAAIIANPSTALYGLLSLGGARRGMTSDEVIDFPYHVISTGDDMGAAGPAGSEEVEKTAFVERLREQTRDSMIANEILNRRMGEFRSLPVIYTRGETDSAASIGAWANGPAMTNFCQTTENFCLAAARLGVPPKVLAVGLDFSLEAVLDTSDDWLKGMYEVMQKITDLFADHGLRKPLFLTQFESGTQKVSDHPVLRAQWQLAWNKGGHDIVYSAPTYMFALDEFGRATSVARLQMAEMDAFAIEAMNGDQDWSCPVFLLAEREEAPNIIRCRAQAMNALIVDENDPLNAGASCGFAFEGCTNDAVIVSVVVDPNDTNDLLITCDIAPIGESLILKYAVGHATSSDGMPANRGAIRDEWHHDSKTGASLHRWALPAALPVH